MGFCEGEGWETEVLWLENIQSTPRGRIQVDTTINNKLSGTLPTQQKAKAKAMQQPTAVGQGQCVCFLGPKNIKINK